MSQCFLDLEQSGPVHRLTKEQKITKSESGLVEDKANSYSIQAKAQWNALPLPQRNFDAYFNIFVHDNPQRRSRISQVGTSRGRGRSYGRGSGRGRGRGRGR